MELRKLSIFFASILMMSLLGLVAHADPVGDEIPYSSGDRRVGNQPKLDHFVSYTKVATCEGQNIAILYQTIGGFSSGTRFIGTCHTMFRDSQTACESDNSRLARICYNKVIDHFKLGDRHAKVDIEEKIDLDAAPTAPAAAASNVSK